MSRSSRLGKSKKPKAATVSQPLAQGAVDTAVDTSLATWPEDCLLHQGLPNPMVYGPDGVWMEVSFLNSRIMESSYRTRPAKCPARGWHNDDVGRPLLDSTQVLLQKAKQVGHPRNGMLNPKGSGCGWGLQILHL
ncbi:unnamed protein product [Cladocopium goreaui]|uniref:Metacaspase-1 n=1 Tax=Cladocopium goreaui TaxID=2562237 RepID=A0A9P1DAY6_9DINO|nr:unnamed protein product [Cladocopium goreaui]